MRAFWTSSWPCKVLLLRKLKSSQQLLLPEQLYLKRCIWIKCFHVCVHESRVTEEDWVRERGGGLGSLPSTGSFSKYLDQVRLGQAWTQPHETSETQGACPGCILAGTTAVRPRNSTLIWDLGVPTSGSTLCTMRPAQNSIVLDNRTALFRLLTLTTLLQHPQRGSST